MSHTLDTPSTRHTSLLGILGYAAVCVSQDPPYWQTMRPLSVQRQTDRHSLIHLSQAWPGLDAQKMGAGVVASTSLMRRLNTKTSLTCLSHRVRKGQSQDQNAV